MYVVPLVPRNISRGDNIPEEEEWIKPYENDNNPDTVQDEQVWAVNQHKFVYNALPVTNALPYVPPDKLSEKVLHPTLYVMSRSMMVQTKQCLAYQRDIRFPAKVCSHTK